MVKISSELVMHCVFQGILPTLSVKINDDLIKSKTLLNLCTPTDYTERKAFLSKVSISNVNNIVCNNLLFKWPILETLI